LEWSSLYYDNEQVVDELWNIKYSENYADSQKTTEEIIGTIAKCNVSESVWSDLLDRIGSQRGISLLSAIVESHSSNVVDFVDIFLQRFDVANLPARIHILVASNEGNFAADIMQVLLNHGLDSKNAVSKLGMTPVHYAAQNESSSGPKLMKLLLENGGDPNRRSTNHDKSTPIQLAASNQGEYAAEIFKLLLDRRCACDELSAGQFEPIHFATMNSGESAPELLDLLLKKRGVSVVNRVTGMSLVHFTMFNNGDGGPIIAKKLFENGAKPNARDKRKQTPLHLAARDTVGEKNQIAIMTVFLQNGGDPNAVDELGRTPVHYAAANEGEYALEKLKLLKDYRGNLAARDKGGLTPVHYTILNKGASGAEMRQLVGYKKGTNIPLNNCGETLLHRLVNGIHNQIHLVQTALESGVNPNVKDMLGCSPVHDAVTEIESCVGLDILKLLLQNGGDANLPDDKNQQTPVHYAAYSLKEWGPKQMEILLSNGGNANAIGTIGYTPLHLAAMNKGNYAPKLTSLLLKSNGNANAVDNCGRSPVHVAVLNENDDTRNQIIKELLENGGNANARDKDGRTPLYYAIAERPTNSLLKNVLINYGGNMAERDNHGMTPNRLLMTRMRR
jgi:ankyrin repeat protein